MENMNHLKDLLKFDVQHLYSAEVQIIEAMSAMIAAASNPQLKQALEEHLRVTGQQRQRLDQVKQLLGMQDDNDSSMLGIFSSLFNPAAKTQGMEGLIDDG